ncbi:MAG: hypothetical protein L3J39_03135 [Verrucomicrobiales bacterium]|nr:hypothetical protein [Verrucomicrobiales bacterium]
MGGAIALLIFPFIFFALIGTQSTTLILLAIVLSLIIHSAMYGPQAAFFSELFGTSVRYIGAPLGYQLTAPFAGGLAPLIAVVLLKWSDGDPWPVAAYLTSPPSSLWSPCGWLKRPIK